MHSRHASAAVVPTGTTNSNADSAAASRRTTAVGGIPVPPLPPPVAHFINIENLRTEDERATVGGELGSLGEAPG